MENTPLEASPQRGSPDVVSGQESDQTPSYSFAHQDDIPVPDASSVQPHENASAAVCSTFKHPPIDVLAGEIRLVRVFVPAEGDTIIRCEMRTAVLNKKLEFQALSYVWGPPSPLVRIQINGGFFSVRSNLHDFLGLLKKAARPFDDEWFWIDQLCIDQQAKGEKGHEVARMGTIFARATRAIIFLGAHQTTTLTQGRGDRPKYWRSTSMNTVEEFVDDHSSNPYWSRLWIIQEVIQARTIVLCDDTRLVHWNAFRNLIGHESDGPKRVQSLGEVRANYGTRGYQLRSWSQALDISIGTKCELIQDQIYGLVGIMYPAIRVEVDYSLSVEEIFLDVMYAEARFADPPYYGEPLFDKLGTALGLESSFRKPLLRFLRAIDHMIDWVKQSWRLNRREDFWVEFKWKLAVRQRDFEARTQTRQIYWGEDDVGEEASPRISPLMYSWAFTMEYLLILGLGSANTPTSAKAAVESIHNTLLRDEFVSHGQSLSHAAWTALQDSARRQAQQDIEMTPHLRVFMLRSRRILRRIARQHDWDFMDYLSEADMV